MSLSYTLKVTYHQSTIWREIELLGVQTLHDLHNAIQQTFTIGVNSNNFAFFMSGQQSNESTEYSVRMRSVNRGVSTTHLLNLALELHQHFFYSFHYKTDFHFTLEVVKIDPAAPDSHYPRLHNAHGHLNLHAIEHGHDAWQHELVREDGAGEFKIESVEPEAAGDNDDGESAAAEYGLYTASDVSGRWSSQS